MDALYLPDGDRFVSTELTRGPWSALHQHGGPPSALIARAFEQRLAAETGGAPFHPARFSIELLRPIPVVPLTITTETVRPGRAVRGLAATCTADGEVVARATALFVRRADIDARTPPTGGAPRTLDESPAHQFSFFTAPVGYHTAMEMRLASGRWGSGAMAVWMRLRVPVVPGEVPSPLQRVVVAADSGNGISAAVDVSRYTFLNADFSVFLHRLPVGEWLCLDARTTVSEGGVGLAESALSDPDGALGRALQCLVISPRT